MSLGLIEEEFAVKMNNGEGVINAEKGGGTIKKSNPLPQRVLK